METTVKLNNNALMPVIGLGTATLKENCENIVYEAIKNGIRLFDTAQSYGNEQHVGNAVNKAIQEGIIKRQDVFIISKIAKVNYPNTSESIEQSLARLNLDYIDLMIIHQVDPLSNQVYKTLEQYVLKGKVKAIGLSNIYDFNDYYETVKDTHIVPSLIQNENNIYYQDQGIAAKAKEKDIVMMAYFSLLGRNARQEILNNKTLREIADKHHKTIPQVIFRYQLQNGYTIIPGIDDPKLIPQNLDTFSFELDNKDIETIRALDKKQRYGTW